MWQKLRLNFLKICFYLFLFSIPFGTRTLIYQFTNGFHEYEAVFLYASDILLLIFLATFWLEEHSRKHAMSDPSVVGPLALGLARPERGRDTMPARPARRFSQKFLKPSSFIAIFLFLAAISIFFAFSKGLAIYNFAHLVLLVLLAFAVAKILKEKITKLENILAIIAGSAVLQAFIGIFQFFKQSSLGLGFLGESVISQEIGGVAKIAIDGAKIIRAYGTFPHPNILAAFLILGLISFYYLWLKKPSIVSSIGIFIVSLGLLFTFSRTAWVLAILGSMALIVYSKNWHLAIIISAIVSILFAVFNPYIISRAKVSGQEPSVSYRVAYNKIALEIIKKNPFGIGIGNQVLYSVKNGIYQKLGMDQAWQWQPIHNIYLLIASEIGILGLLAFLGFLIKTLLSSKNVIVMVLLLSLLAFGLVDHFLWTLQPGRLMFWLVIGTVWGLTRSDILDADLKESGQEFKSDKGKLLRSLADLR